MAAGRRAVEEDMATVCPPRELGGEGNHKPNDLKVVVV
jgi:hypothetical protein